jgi:hypothetical protein
VYREIPGARKERIIEGAKPGENALGSDPYPGQRGFRPMIRMFTARDRSSSFNGLRAALEKLPLGWRLLTLDPNSGFDRDKFQEGLQAASRLERLFGRSGTVPVIGMPHHGNHAAFSYLVSPFAQDSQPTMIVVAHGAPRSQSILAPPVRSGSSATTG